MISMKSQPRLCTLPGGDRVVLIRENSEVMISPARLDLCYPFSSRFVPAYTGNTASIRRRSPHVTSIHPVTDDSQVGLSIVRFVAVDMVYVFSWPIAMQKSPRNTMGFISPRKNHPRQIAVKPNIIQRRCSCVPRVPAIPASLGAKYLTPTLKPHQMASFSIVSDQLIKFDRDTGGAYQRNSHGEQSFRGGQGRALLTQRFRPAFFSKIIVCEQQCSTAGALSLAREERV